VFGLFSDGVVFGGRLCSTAADYGESALIRVSFTPNLQRHVECPTTEVEAATVADALEAVFRSNPRLRGYILDDQGEVRKHVAVFVNGRLIADRIRLTDAVPTGGEIFVMQALSGG